VNKIDPTKMNETCIYHIDLVSKKKFGDSKIGGIVKSIKSVASDHPLRNLILDHIEINERDRIEIYCESETSDSIPAEDMLEMLSLIESEVDGFTEGSRIEMRVEIPLSEKTWIKTGYDWELAFEQTDSYLDENYDAWGDPEWNDYE